MKINPHTMAHNLILIIKTLEKNQNFFSKFTGNFRVRFFGEQAAAWKNFFRYMVGYSQFDDGTLYYPGTQSTSYVAFTLFHSTCDLEMEVI